MNCIERRPRATIVDRPTCSTVQRWVYCTRRKTSVLSCLIPPGLNYKIPAGNRQIFRGLKLLIEVAWILANLQNFNFDYAKVPVEVAIESPKAIQRV